MNEATSGTYLNLPDPNTIQLSGEPKLEYFSTLEEYLKTYWTWLERELAKKRAFRPNPDDWEPPAWYRVCDEYHEWNKQHPATKRAAKLFQSIYAVENLIDRSHDVVCPICDKSGKDNLVLKCHPDMTLKQIIEFTMLKRGAEYVQKK